MDYKRVTIDGESKINRGLAHHVVYELMQYPKSLCQVDAKTTHSDLKEHGGDVCETVFYYCFVKLKEIRFQRPIVAGDECWIFQFQTETKEASKEWRHSSLLKS